MNDFDVENSFIVKIVKCVYKYIISKENWINWGNLNGSTEKLMYTTQPQHLDKALK